MIEAIEVHETRIKEPIPVQLRRPIYTGVCLGIGLILAPGILILVLILFGFILISLRSL